MTTTEEHVTPERGGLPLWASWLIPLVLLAGLIVLFINTNPVQVSYGELPPVEDLAIQRIDVTASGFEVHVTNAGPDPVVIAQVFVDEAYWQYTITPGHTLNRLQTAVLTINYPWVETEPHEIVILTSTGTTFSA